MKKIYAFFGIIFFCLSLAQVNWMTMEQALEAQKSNPKKILIDFYADWCGPCKLMEKNTYGNPIIADFINQNYYPVKFNTESNESITYLGKTFKNPNYKTGKSRNNLHEFTKFMNVSSVPSLVFLDENGNPITILNGMLTAKEVEPYLVLISNDDYKKIKTRQQWDDYQRKFKSKIK